MLKSAAFVRMPSMQRRLKNAFLKVGFCVSVSAFALNVETWFACSSVSAQGWQETPETGGQPAVSVALQND